VKITDAKFEDDELKIFLEDGRVCRIFHDQDCCETVKMIQESRDLSEIIGEEMTAIDIDSRDNGAFSDESSTITKVTISIENWPYTYSQLWLGESNGYYSEALKLLAYDTKIEEEPPRWIDSLSTPWKP
jgi:hypothetical protein